jgi:CDGSH-type Zn-finger protein
MEKEGKIVVRKDGPYVVSNLPLSEGVIKTDNSGHPVSIEKTKDYKTDPEYCLCRCGKSLGKPFCDGAHTKVSFNGTETANEEIFQRSKDIVEGPSYILEDTIPLCSSAGFCHGKEGNTWDLISSKDKKSNEMGIKQSCNCTSGRLVVLDKKTKKPIEEKFKPSIMILKEPWKKVGSSIWAIGEVPIICYDGKKYKPRNRVALCRCGESTNKPFCDGSHISTGFKG